MKQSRLNQYVTRILPYLFLGFVLVLFVIGIIIFSYVLIIGTIIGLVLFSISYLRTRFLSKKQQIKPTRPPRTIDHE